MNALAPHPISGEIIPPRTTVRVVGRAHPLAGARIDYRLPAGWSITELLNEALADRPELQGRRDFIVHLDGHPIEQQNWSRIRVKPGVTLTFLPRLQGGAGVWRSVFAVVVAVAALIIAPYAAPGIVSGLAAIGVS